MISLDEPSVESDDVWAKIAEAKISDEKNSREINSIFMLFYGLIETV